jgi:NAD(P)-dependent dehydrogenase (short-subunit alcohol dehydrogenase family)
MQGYPFSLEGQAAVVTGARRGIGRSIALMLASAGADLFIGDQVVEDKLLSGVCEEIKKTGRRCSFKQVDVTSKSSVEGFIKAAAAELGTIDILVNNAGVGIDTKMLDTSEEEWQKVLDINLKGAFLCSQAASPLMIEKQKGNIINVSSCTGIRAFGSRNVYNISKAALIMETKLLARELGKFNIRVNTVAPAVVKTEMSKDISGDPAAAQAEARRIPLGRLAEPEDIAGPVYFLASGASSYITGHVLIIDGGQMA